MADVETRLLEQVVDRAIEARQTLSSSGGGGTSGGVTEDWKESVDRRLGALHDDIRSLLKAGIAAIVALAIGIGGLYLYVGTKTGDLDARLRAVEITSARSDEKLTNANSKLDAIAAKLDRRSR